MKNVFSKGADMTHQVTSSFSKKLPYLQMPAFSHKPSAYTGPSYEEVLRTRKQHISLSTFAFYRQPVMVVEGKMQYLFDHAGKRYLDLFAGIATSGLGHCHPRINGKVKE